jgi:hypothetical protein
MIIFLFPLRDVLYHSLFRFQAYIVFKGSDSLKIHFRGWSVKWDEVIAESKFESRLRPRIEITAIGAERVDETFDDVASDYGCQKFKFCAPAEEDSSCRVSDERFLFNSDTQYLCEEIDACDAAGQW